MNKRKIVMTEMRIALKITVNKQMKKRGIVIETIMNMKLKVVKIQRKTKKKSNFHLT